MSKKSKLDRGLYRRRGSPHWWIRYADRNGRIIRESTGTTEKKLAKAILAKKKVLVAENRHLEVRKKPGTSFFELCNLYWEKKGQRLRMKGLSSMIRAWKVHFGSVVAEDLTQARVEDFLISHVEERGLSPTTRNRHIAQLKALFSWGMKWKTSKHGMPLITHNPAGELKKIDEDPYKRERFLAADEIDRLINACRRPFRSFVMAALHTGMRPGELFELLWKDVNFRSGLVYVRKSKVGKARYIPMNESLRNALKDLPSRFRGDYVFPSPKAAGKLDNVKK